MVKRILVKVLIAFVNSIIIWAVIKKIVKTDSQMIIPGVIVFIVTIISNIVFTCKKS